MTTNWQSRCESGSCIQTREVDGGVEIRDTETVGTLLVTAHGWAAHEAALRAQGWAAAVAALRDQAERVWTSPGPPEAAVISLRLEKSAEFLTEVRDDTKEAGDGNG